MRCSSTILADIMAEADTTAEADIMAVAHTVAVITPAVMARTIHQRMAPLAIDGWTSALTAH
jgi:hypothetical protein